MKKLIYTFLIGLFLLTISAQGEEITKQSFIGKWCGKWDNIYSLCITIDNIESDAVARYQWKEHQKSKFKKTTKKIERINLNTLKIDNIWFALDETNLNRVNVMGVFRVQTRIAILEKSPTSQTEI